MSSKISITEEISKSFEESYGIRPSKELARILIGESVDQLLIEKGIISIDELKKKIKEIATQYGYS